MLIEGFVEKIIFHNKENAYTVMDLSTEDGPIVCVGFLPFAEEGKHFALEGEIVYHDSYGEQFSFEKAEIIVPRNRSSIIKYLSSGIFPHIGEKTAERIVDLYGDETMSLIEDNPDLLLKVKGLGKKKLGDIVEVLENQRISRQMIFSLQNLNFTVRQAMKIYEIYGEESLNKVTEDPYGLIGAIHGIGFMTADDIAVKNGISKGSTYRIRAGINYVLTSSANSSGDCFLYWEELVEKTSNLLGLSQTDLDNALKTLVIDGKLILGDIEGRKVIYEEDLYKAEDLVALRLASLVKLSKPRKLSKEPEEILSKDTHLDESQKKAVIQALSSKLTIITGGPGTGKTTIVKKLVEVAEDEGLTVLLGAPTGRAAKRLEESTNRQASTIHRLLKYSSGEDSYMEFECDRDDPLDGDMIIIDEASMIDIRLMASLADAIRVDASLVLVGDVNQLPSVGPGNVLRDIIDSKLASTTILEKIYRQSQESNIVLNAHRINKGVFPVLNEEGKDFFFLPTQSYDKTQSLVVDLVSERLPRHYNLEPKESIQVLSVMKKGPLGTVELNKKLQEKINSLNLQKDRIEYREDIFALGDKVMQNVNNYSIEYRDTYGNIGEGVYNGDIGFISEINSDKMELKVYFDDGKEVKYGKENLSELMLSYAITIHKSQGSEFDIALIPLYPGPYMLLTRNLIYTAITRAKKVVVLVGSSRVLKKMIENETIRNRNSSLDLRIKERVNIFEDMDYAN